MQPAHNPPDPTKAWAHRLGRYRFLPSENAVQFEDGRKIAWPTLLKSLTEGTAAGSSGTTGSNRSKAGQQPTSQTTKTGTTLSTYTDKASGQEAKIESGEAERLTPQELQDASIAANRRIVETRSTRGSATSKYKVQSNPQAVSKLGIVIELLYPEYAGGDSAITPTREFAGEWRMRRFVIIEPRSGCSAALPISTYNGQGVAKSGVIRQHHLIIYTGSSAPGPTPQEGPVRLPNGEVDTLRRPAIQVIPARVGSALDPMSRLNLREHFVIDHHVEMFIFGQLTPQSAQSLLYQFRDAQPAPRPATVPSRPSAPPTVTESSRPKPLASNEEDDEEDQEVISLALRVRAMQDPEKAKVALANLKRHDETRNTDLYPRVIAYLRRTAGRSR